MHQRVTEQQDAVLLSFAIVIYYNNSTAIRINSLEEFREFAETRQIHPTIVNLEWKYDVLFPGGVGVERQEIDVSIKSTLNFKGMADIQASHEAFRMSGDKIQVETAKIGSSSGIITYNIEHTRASWGLDIENHLNNQIQRLFREKQFLEKAWENLGSWFDWFTTLVFFSVATVLCVRGFHNIYFDSAVDINLESINDYLFSGDFAVFLSASIVITIFSFIFSMIATRYLFIEIFSARPSFITLSEYDETRKAEALTRHKRKTIKVILIFIIDAILLWALLNVVDVVSHIEDFLVG